MNGLFKVLMVCVVLSLLQCKVQRILTLEKINEIDLFIQQNTKEGFSGVVLVSEADKTLLAKGYGFADMERKTSNNDNTIFEIASITKLFTTVAILQLVENGSILLDDKISKYLGDFDAPKDRATIRHLLLHTAGLIPKGHDLKYHSKLEFLQSVKSAPAESLPGETYRYTNAGYIVLAAIIEEVSRLSYEDYLIKNIFQPLNLNRTTFGIKDTIHNMAQGYVGRTVEELKVYRTPSLVWGDRGPSGILSNVYDLHKFIIGLNEGVLIGEKFFERMRTEQREGEAFGFHVLNKPALGKVLARGGGLPHFESQIAWYEEKDIKVILLINNHLRKRQPVWDGIEQIIFKVDAN